MSARFCGACGAPLPRLDPSAAGHPVCGSCGVPDYRNPAVHAACIAGTERSGARLCSTLVETGETIQAAALRALGIASGSLALYCTLTDLQRGAVYLVFRLRGAAAGALPPAGDEPPRWAEALCRRFLADAAAGLMPVYTASFDGAVLDLAEVPADPDALSARPA